MNRINPLELKKADRRTLNIICKGLPHLFVQEKDTKTITRGVTYLYNASRDVPEPTGRDLKEKLLWSYSQLYHSICDKLEFLNYADMQCKKLYVDEYTIHLLHNEINKTIKKFQSKFITLIETNRFKFEARFVQTFENSYGTINARYHLVVEALPLKPIRANDLRNKLKRLGEVIRDLQSRR